MNTTFGPTYFVKWLFSQDEAWLSADGEWHVLAKDYPNSMHTHHVLNTLLMLERISLDVYRSLKGYELKNLANNTQRETAAEWMAATKLYKALKSRLTDELH